MAISYLIGTIRKFRPTVMVGMSEKIALTELLQRIQKTTILEDICDIFDVSRLISERRGLI